jgi:predicted MPP superfamily phosphohydrolase
MYLQRRGFSGPFYHGLSWVSFTLLGFMALLFVFTVLKDLGLISYKILNIFSTPSISKIAENNLSNDRRTFLLQALNLATLGITGVATGYGFFQARRHIKIKNQPIYAANISPELNELKIVQISDLHVGPTIKKDFVERVVEQTNALNADILVFTGDMVDGSVSSLAKDVAPLAKLTATYGKYFVSGNHEYYSNYILWEKKIKELGFTVLNNENTVIDVDGKKILLAGVTDYTAETILPNQKSDPLKAFTNAPNDSFKILLAHQPKSAFKAKDIGYDLQISGHTHGGQFFPGNFLARLDQPFIAGLYHYGNMQIYVNTGTGYWGPPLRLATRSEITEIVLKS